MFAMMTSDAYLYLYAAAIRADRADPAAVARKGAEDFDAFRAEQDAAREAAAVARDEERSRVRDAMRDAAATDA